MAVEDPHILRQHIIGPGRVVDTASVRIAIICPNRIYSREVLDCNQIWFSILDKRLELEVCYGVTTVLGLYPNITISRSITHPVFKIDPVFLSQTWVKQVVNSQLEFYFIVQIIHIGKSSWIS